MAPPPPVELHRPPDHRQNVRSNVAHHPPTNNSKLSSLNAAKISGNAAVSRNCPTDPIATGPCSGELRGGATMGVCSPSSDLRPHLIAEPPSGEISGDQLFIAGAESLTGEIAGTQRKMVSDDDVNSIMPEAPISSHQNVSNLTLKFTPPRANSAVGGAAAGIHQMAVCSDVSDRNKECNTTSTESPINVQQGSSNLQVRVQPQPVINIVADGAPVKHTTDSRLKAIIEENAGTTAQQIQIDKAGTPSDPPSKPNNKSQSSEKGVVMNVAESVAVQSKGPKSTFPKISANFDKHTPKTGQPNQIEKSTNNAATTSVVNGKNNLVPEPAPFTVVQTYATRLRANHTKNEVPIQLVEPTLTTRQGLPAVIFDAADVMVKLADRCKFTLIGKFVNSMPKMEVIRKQFILQTQLTGGVKIAHYNPRHVYIDLDNEQDYITVWTQQRMYIDNQLMRLQKWTPTFTPKEETPIVPVWVTLPELPWHFYNKEFITALLSPVGQTLYLDTASIQKTCGSMAKVRLQINLTDELPPHIWIGFDKNDLTVGKWQAIHYEDIPAYCSYCKHQGHLVQACNVKRRDDEYRKKKDADLVVKSMDQQLPAASTQVPPKEPTSQAITITTPPSGSGTKADHQHQPQNQQSQPREEWQTQKKKNFKGVTQTNQKNKATAPQLQVYKPTSSAQQNIKLQQKQQTKQVMIPIEANKTTGIDSMLHQPRPINIITALVSAEKSGGAEGGLKEKPINLQEGDPQGSGRALALHEHRLVDHRMDCRAPATTSYITPAVQAQDTDSIVNNAQGRTIEAIDESAKVQARRIHSVQVQAEVANSQIIPAAHPQKNQNIVLLIDHAQNDVDNTQKNGLDSVKHDQNLHRVGLGNRNVILDCQVIQHIADHAVIPTLGIRDQLQHQQDSEVLTGVLIDPQSATCSEIPTENDKVQLAHVADIHNVQAFVQTAHCNVKDAQKMVQGGVPNIQNDEFSSDQANIQTASCNVDDAPKVALVTAPAQMECMLADNTHHVTAGSQMVQGGVANIQNDVFSSDQAVQQQIIVLAGNARAQVIQDGGIVQVVNQNAHGEVAAQVIQQVADHAVVPSVDIRDQMQYQSDPVVLTDVPAAQFTHCNVDVAENVEVEIVTEVVNGSQLAKSPEVDSAKRTDARYTFQNQYDEVFAQEQQLGNVSCATENYQQCSQANLLIDTTQVQQIVPSTDGSASAKMMPQNMGIDVFTVSAHGRPDTAPSKAADNSVFSSTSTSNSISVASRTTRVKQKTRSGKQLQVTHHAAQVQQNAHPAPGTFNTNPTSPPAEEDEYRVIESENEKELDTHSISDEAEEEHDSVQLPEHVELDYHSTNQAEVQQVADRQVTSITWKKPAADFYKLNTDGSALQNPGSIGGGGILRDHHGNLIYAFSTPFGIGTNNQAEVKAAIFGVTWCIQHGYTKLILEVDSALLIQWLTHHIQPPWRLDTDILELQKLVSQLESFQSRHVYREANYTADALSKYSHHYDITQQYYTHQQLPRAAKGYFILDKLGTMSFRRRKLKRIKKPP
ncbi:hypothetical protein CQW23_33091 [Capsicum baccatum]|uniref:RNase H type-1 domain-containing protein n=1 Tax=Capsicum baccatum TaxID=33114 RepID=A0A2G2V2T8_CAPBA|nr:hypothetical protein CQW23_33091 [Capsicum baccatum]